MIDSNVMSSTSQCLAPTDSGMDLEIARIIGNARSKRNACLMARNQYGLREFGRLFYLMADLDKPRLEESLDFIDEVKQSHEHCIRCSLKFVAFCRIFCGNQLPQRQAAYESEYAEMLKRFGPGRDFMSEVWDVIDRARPTVDPRLAS